MDLYDIAVARKLSGGSGGGGSGDSDFSTAQVTLATTVEETTFYIPHAVEGIDVPPVPIPSMSISDVHVFSEDGSYTITAILYKGTAHGSFSGGSSASVTGNVRVDDFGTGFEITGDGTITIS